MEVVQSSVLGRLLLPVWLWLRARYEYSLLARVLPGDCPGLEPGLRRKCPDPICNPGGLVCPRPGRTAACAGF